MLCAIASGNDWFADQQYQRYEHLIPCQVCLLYNHVVVVNSTHCGEKMLPPDRDPKRFSVQRSLRLPFGNFEEFVDFVLSVTFTSIEPLL